MCYPLWYVPERRDAHEPVESSQLSTVTHSSTSLAVSRCRTDAVPTPDAGGFLVSPANLGDLAAHHADGS